MADDTKNVSPTPSAKPPEAKVEPKAEAVPKPQTHRRVVRRATAPSPAEPRHAYVEVGESFTTTIRGEAETFREGEVVEGSHPAVRKYPAQFRDLTLAHPIGKPEIRS